MGEEGREGGGLNLPYVYLHPSPDEGKTERGSCLSPFFLRRGEGAATRTPVLIV